jgi:hypothetical protein
MTTLNRRNALTAVATLSACRPSRIGTRSDTKGMWPPTEGGLLREFSNLLGKDTPLPRKVSIRRFHHLVACL